MDVVAHATCSNVSSSHGGHDLAAEARSPIIRRSIARFRNGRALSPLRGVTSASLRAATLNGGGAEDRGRKSRAGAVVRGEVITPSKR
jgi:hypothetical protein